MKQKKSVQEKYLDNLIKKSAENFNPANLCSTVEELFQKTEEYCATHSEESGSEAY